MATARLWGWSSVVWHTPRPPSRLEHREEQREHAALQQGLPVRGHRGGLGAEAQAPP